MKNLIPLPFGKVAGISQHGLRPINVVSETWRYLRSVAVILLLSAATMLADNAILTLEKSTDGLSTWQTVPLTAQMLTLDGKIDAGAASGSAFFRMRFDIGIPGMVSVLGGTLPFSISDLGSVSAFYIGKYEMTWGEWKTVRTWAAANGYDIGSVGFGNSDAHPVDSVSWYDVVKWCNARSEKEGLTPVYMAGGVIYRTGEFGADGSTAVSQNASANGYRLPTEAEWEWAARGGVSSQGYNYSGSNDVNAVAWFDSNSGSAQPVGTKAGNELGIYDMSGNVWEWCWDLYDPASSYRCDRGGSWTHDLGYCILSYRGSDIPSTRYGHVGFRLARSSGN